MPEPLSVILGHIGAGLATDLFEDLFGPVSRGGGMWARWEIGKRTLADDWLREGFDSLREGQAHGLLGLSPKGLMYGVEKIMDATTKMSMIIEGEMVEELFLELIQEGLSNAVQTSFGGAYQTMLNVYRGGQPPYPDHVADIMQYADSMDDELRSFLAASTGASIPNFMMQAIVGTERQLDGEEEHLKRYLVAKIDDKDDVYYRTLLTRRTIAFQYAEAQAEKEWMVRRRASDMISDAARRYLARVNELLDELEAVKAWYDAELISEGDATLIAAEMQIEAGVIGDYFVDLNNAITNKVTEIVSALEYDFTPVTETQAAFEEFARKVWDAFYDQHSALLYAKQNHFNETLARLRAYRYYTEPGLVEATHTPPDYPIGGPVIVTPVLLGFELGRLELGKGSLA